jgi:hypothetical protein
MKAWITTCILLSALTLRPASAEFINLRTDVENEFPRVEINSHGAEQVQFEVRLPVVDRTEIILDGQKWDQIDIPGGSRSPELGHPDIPRFSRLLAIPAMTGVRVTFEALETTTISNIELLPVQNLESEQSSPDQRLQFDMNAYSRDIFYPDVDVAAGEPAIMRGLRLIPIQMNPVRYNPVSKDLQVVHRYRVTIHFEGTDLRNVPTRPVRPLSLAWKRIMSGTVLNLDELDLDESGMGSYLIICENDNYLVNTLLPPLIDWKKRKGHTVTVETFSPGASTTTIKNIIQNAYNNWDIPPEYVLLWGDTSGDYVLPGWESYHIDHPYSQLDGTDILADVAIGRLPAANDYETIVMVNKVLFYEKMPYIANDEWFHQSVLTAGSGSGSSPIQTNRWIKTRMVWHNYTRIDTMWYTMGGSISNTITNAVNNGVTYYNFRGYWGGGLSTSGINALTNGRKLVFATDITCGSGGFSGDSQMEHWVSVGTPTTPKGAIAAVGTATLSTHTRFNNTVDMGIYAGLFDEEITQAGNALNRGKLELYIAYQANSPSNVTNFSKWNALAGDPGVELYTGAIRYMECSVPSTVTWGENALALTVNETSVGPLEGAVVCLYREGDIHEVGLTDVDGQVTLPLNVLAEGNVKVTITKQNFYPVVDSLDVVQDAVAVGYFDHAIDDDAIGSSSGDNDGTINPGETVEIPVTMKNFGSATTATSVTSTAAVSDAYATLDDNYETFPDMSPGSTGISGDDFDLTIAPDCPHGHTVTLNLQPDATQGNWDSVFDLEVISYDMLIQSAVATGGDTLLSPGETSDFLLTVRNAGGKSATNLTASVVSLDPYVTVNDGMAGFGTVSIGASTTCSSNPFNLTANSGAPNGHPADLEITFTSSQGYTQTDTITIALGAKTSTDPQGPDEYGYYCFDNTDFYPQAPVYNWVEIDPSYGGSGTQLPINDPSENDDVSINLQLPFTFRYYGENVDEITVCSNGWISTWANNSFTDFRNYPIPSCPGPNGMIAAFWDDLITWSGGHVFAMEDIDNHRFIVEWSRMKNLGSPQPQETFEIILYDPAYYSTPTGDGEILFQYNSITEVSGPYDDNPYSTVGIERPDQQDGIEVVYWNTYDDPATAHLQNGRAYLFTTNFLTGGDPPVIGVNPTSLTINVPEGGISSEQLTISNNGELYLAFSTALSYDGFSWIVPSGLSGSDDMGGPDDFGYLWMDSDEPGGPTYDWVDISAVGTLVSFVHNDSTAAELPIGFSFPFYGEMRSEFIVSANGWLSFSSHAGAWNNTTLPNTEAPGDLVSGFWDDLDPLQAGAEVLYWSNDTDSLIVSFLDVPHWGSTTTGTYTFQMILMASGSITYQYQTLVGDYQSCTIGIQNGTGTDGLQVAYNQSYLHNNLAVHFYHPFLIAEPSSGSVPGGGSMELDIVAYAFGMEQGTYPATLGIDCNDPVTPHMDVPISVIVGDEPPIPIEVAMTPHNPPIVIPSGGGSFELTAGITNQSAGTLQTDFWIMVDLPNGTPYGPILLRQDLVLSSGASITRDLTQQVPTAAPSGTYYYYGIAGVYPDSITAINGFNFTKETGSVYGGDYDDWAIFGWDEIVADIPEEFSFGGCYPNPFNPVTKVQFALPQMAHVQIRIFDVMGREVAVIQSGSLQAGIHQLHWDASAMASGVYFLTFRAGDIVTTEKLLLMK